jgi:hypothetical protein
MFPTAGGASGERPANLLSGKDSAFFVTSAFTSAATGSFSPAALQAQGRIVRTVQQLRCILD